MTINIGQDNHIKTFFESLMEGNYIKAVDSIKNEMDSRLAEAKKEITEKTHAELGFKKKIEEAKDEDEDEEPSDKEKEDGKKDSDSDEDESDDKDED